MPTTKKPPPPVLFKHRFHRQATIDFIKAVANIGFNKVSVETAKKGARTLMKKLNIQPD